MDVISSDVVRDQYLTPFKITPERIKETVTHEDVKKTIKLHDYIFLLFMKKYDSYYILVIGRWNPSSFSLLISSAYIIDQQLIKNIYIDNPLAVLEQSAKEFGYDVELGDQKSKFIHDARIQIPSASTMADFSNILNANLKLSDNGSYNIRPCIGDMIVSAQEL
jgi:hypothetical protein